MTTTTINFSNPPTKKEIVERLFKAGHINLDEVLELMKEPSAVYIPVDAAQPYNPWTLPNTPWTYTVFCD